MKLFSTISRLTTLKSFRNFHAKVIDNFSNRIKVSGYESENYNVKTKDGYFLTIHRMLPKPQQQYKGPAFLMHGLFRNSADFIASGPNNSLAYFLAENGYDVWLGNCRGSRYSRQHEKHSVNSKDFWNFSFHEIGLYDVSAMIDFMLDQTGNSKTFYVGHSQGCSSLLALLSLQPNYNEKIIEAHLMTPSLILKHARSPMLTLSAKHFDLVTKYAKVLGKFDISPVLKISQMLTNIGGYNHKRALKLYEKFTCTYVGRNKEKTQISEEALESFQTLMSPQVSAMQLLHFLQLHISGKFQQFDHKDKNVLHYNSSIPPEYNLSNVTAPMHLYSASEDILITPQSVQQLGELLPNVRTCETLKDWNHVDVMLGKDSREVLYKKILKSMNEWQ